MKKEGRDYLIHLKHKFCEKQIIFHDLNYKKKYPLEVEKIISSEWDKIKTNKNTYIFNGAVSCLDHFQIIENELHIYYCESDYRSYFGTNIKNSKKLEDRSSLANTLAVCTLVETADKMIIVGKRGAHLAEGTSLWHVPGGTLEYYPDRVNHPFEVMRRELKEELNLTSIDKMICLGLGENLNYKKPEFLLYTKSNLTASEIEKDLHFASDYNEHSEIRFIPCNQIEDFLAKYEFTEIGTAAIKLYLEMI